MRCPIPAFPAIQARKSFHCWEQIGQDTGVAPAFPPASCPLPLGLRVGAEPWGGDGSARDQVRWGGQGKWGCSGQRPGKARVWAALSPHRLPLTYNTPGSPRHKVTMSADTDCHLFPGLATTLLLACRYLSSPSSPVKMEVRSWWLLSTLTH